MADNEPMSDERLAEIRALLAEVEQARERLHNVMGGQDRPRAPMANTANDLLAEVDRLRTENAAMREIVQAVAERGSYFTLQMGRRCYFCEMETDRPTGEPPHTADCPVAKARALLATPQGQES